MERSDNKYFCGSSNMQSSSSLEDLPSADYAGLDLSFDDIPPIASSSTTAASVSAADPTEFTKPAVQKKDGSGDYGGDGDDDFLDDNAYILGTLLVRIVAARNLPSVRGGNVLQKLLPGQSGTTNAYASIRFGLTTQRTTIVRDTADPLWPRQEFLYMDVTHPVLEDQGQQQSTTTSQDESSSSFNNQHEENPSGRKKKAPPTVAKLPTRKTSPKAAAAASSKASFSSNNNHVHSSSLHHQQPPPLDPPVLTIGLFHAAHAANPQKYNPSKPSPHHHQQNRGDSDDVFLGMTSMDVTTLLTGKERSFDNWWPLQGGPDHNHNNNKSNYSNAPSSVRVIVEYEPSDTAPRPGDKVKFTRYCHASDIYPLSPYGTYEVVTADGGDNVTIGWTTPEGWCTSVIVKRHALVCEERQVGVNERDQLLPSWGTIGERLQQSPLVQTLQTSVARVPDEGLLGIAQDALTNGQGLLARWFQGGLGTAVADVRHATNWDGEASPTAEESLELHAPPLAQDETTEQAAVLSVEEEDNDSDQETNKSILPNMPVCPISQQPMHDPVVAADGHTYERSAIARWLATSDKSPLTGAVLAHKELVPNYMLLSSLREAAAASSMAAAATAAGVKGASILQIEPTPLPVEVAAAADGAMVDDVTNDVPSLVDEDEGDLREENF